jgi:hypothetical protein
MPSPNYEVQTMNMRILSSAIATLALGLSTAALAEKGETYANKWRIETSGGSQTAGELVFRVKQNQGPTQDVVVAIAAGRAENNVARDIRDALKEQLASAKYTVETDDGEDVLVKLPEGSPNFSLQLVKSSLENVSVEIERE